MIEDLGLILTHVALMVGIVLGIVAVALEAAKNP